MPPRASLRQVNKIFVGWNTAQNGAGIFYADSITLQITADTTLYAMWSGNGGLGGPFYIYNEETLAAIGTDTGDYVGWTLSADYLVVSDITLIAP